MPNKISDSRENTMENRFEMTMAVRFQDIDRTGHVHNAVFFTYFTEARLAFFQQLIEGTAFSQFPSILAHIDCDFIRPIFANTLLTVGIWVKEIGSKSFTLGYRLTDASDSAILYAAAESIQVCYDYEANGSIAVPDELRRKLSENQ
jgi:acyl-CoA thioester hydrolase